MFSNNTSCYDGFSVDEVHAVVELYMIRYHCLGHLGDHWIFHALTLTAMCTGGHFTRDKARQSVTLTTHPDLVSRSRARRRYISSPPKHHCGV